MKSWHDVIHRIIKNTLVIHSFMTVMFLIGGAISLYFSFIACNLGVGYNLANDVINGLPDPGNPNPPGETRNAFRIYHIYMESAPSLCYYGSGGMTYEGFTAIREAYAKCNTTISVKGKFMTEDIIWIDTPQDLVNWQVSTMTAAGIYNNGSPNRDISILYGCINMDENIASEETLGFTSDRTPSYPSASFILSDHISATAAIQFPSSPGYWANVCLSNVVCHELGHAREIHGDDPSIKPPHSGSNQTTCAMAYLGTALFNTSPNFCDGHRDHIKTITW